MKVKSALFLIYERKDIAIRIAVAAAKAPNVWGLQSDERPMPIAKDIVTGTTGLSD
jgi:hypothetical protein